MKKHPYIVKQLSIRKMPGFPRGLKSLDNLAANINIITGPNASGKSSTARMIKQLIWPKDTKGLEVEGSVHLDEDSWKIKIDFGNTLVQRNGIEDDFSGLPAKEGRSRYLLALHDLIEAEETNLAKEIARQSIGGFDLDAAHKDLGYSSRFSTGNLTEYRDYKEIEEKYRKIRDQQRDLKKEEESLSLLKFEAKKARAALRLLEFYNQVANYLAAELEYSQLSEQIQEFPKSMEDLSGNEYDAIEEYENQIDGCENRIKTAENDIEKCRKELKKLTIPETGIDDKKISEIEKRLDRMSTLDRDISEYKKQIASLKPQEKEALTDLDDSINPSEWKDLSLDDIGGLDKMLQDAHQALGEKAFLISEIDMLKKEAEKYQKSKQRPEIFVQGIKTLSDWLKESTGKSGISLGMVIFISLAGMATAVAVFFVGWYGLFGILLILVLFLYAYFTKDKGSNSLHVRESDFTKSGLEKPAVWNTENVVDRIDELIETLGDLKEAEQISQRLNSSKERLNKLQSRLKSINENREKWMDRLQTAPGFPEIDSNDFSSMYWFINKVKIWQDANIKRAVLEAESSEAKNQYDDELRKINGFFERINYPEVKDVVEGKANFEDLKSQENKRKEQVRIIDQKNIDIEEQGKLKSRNEDRLSLIYKKLNIEQNDKEILRGLINQLGDYNEKNKKHYASEQEFLKIQKQLQAHSLYVEHKEGISSLTVDQAQQKSSKNEEIANTLEGIQREITEVETLIRDKKQGHELEDILAEKENALDHLHQAYEKNVSSVTGSLIISQLNKETQNKNRPKVFKRANEIFNHITNGRYELLLDEKGEPNFRAFDTVLKLGQDLTELSTGTRVQLLLAVRLAYVETVESSIKLPLLADELLANSDDERAKAIIDALIKISKEGRQVFYFTAQADEVDKWMAHLKDEKDLDHKVFQLNGDSEKSYDYSKTKLDPNRFSLSLEVSAPNGKNHEEYGQVIQRQPFNLLMQDVNELSLWYLIEDVDLLYLCLKRGIKTWGQLESFYRNNGRIQSLNEEKYSQFQKRIELLKRLQELYQQGRSRPIDQEILESSGVISEAFMDRVVAKLEALNRDPRKLIHALKTGEIPRFRTVNAEELEQYLIAEGYINDQDLLEEETMRIRLSAFISSAGMDADEAEGFIDRVLEG